MKADRPPMLCAALALALVATPATAFADPVDACLRAADEAQVLRDQGKLLASRERLLGCSRASCPSMVRADCAGWLADVEARVPSVVLGAQEADGRDVVDVKVTVDGVAQSGGLSGRALPLDPGAHRFAFERRGSSAPPVEQTVVLREGEHRRLVSARFPGAKGKAPLPPLPAGGGGGLSRGAIAASITLGSVALAGGGAFAGLAFSAKRDFDHLDLTCAPTCKSTLVDPVRTKELAANVSLGVGLGAAVAAVLILVLRPGEASPSTVSFHVSPAPGGLGLGATF